MISMHHQLVHLHWHLTSWNHQWSEVLLAVVLSLLLLVSPASAAAMRFQERSLYINDSEPGATTYYTVAWRYMSPEPVGSVDMLFCVDPIPYHPCQTPPGLNVSNAELTEQSGEAGFSILTKSTNHIVLSRSPATTPTSINPSSYTFDNIKNPTDQNQSFSIRLRSHSSLNATGPQIDFGSVKGQVAKGIIIETQVPPMLIFCLAQEVEDNCTDTNDVYYTNMGQLDTGDTLTAQSQMAVGTNATAGFVITANGGPPAAGTHVIAASPTPTQNRPGTNQFGINLVANNSPAIGGNPEGIWANATPAPDYAIADKYKFVPGDTVASSTSVSLMKKFTVSYILNASPSLTPGVYTTTVTFIASGRF